MKCKGAIFDMDGTLIDSMTLWDNLGELYVKKQGKSPEAGLTEKLKSMSLPQSAQYLKKRYALPYTEREIIEQVDTLIAYEYRNEIPLKPYAASFLEKLKKDGVKMCVATATNYPLAKGALDRLGVLNYFDFILTCTEAGLSKDGPEFYLMALEKLGTAKAETVVFEDTLHAIRSSKAAGLYTVGVYDAYSKNDTLNIKELADQYIRSFEEWEDFK